MFEWNCGKYNEVKDDYYFICIESDEPAKLIEVTKLLEKLSKEKSNA